MLVHILSRRSAVMHRTVLLAALLTSVASPLFAQVAGKASAEQVAPLSIGETFTITSPTLHEVRRINVYVPADLPGGPQAPIPVLYMPDGGIKEDFLHVAGLLQVSVGNGTMRPFMLVGIENTERRRDMTGPTDDPQDRKIAPHVGGSAAFRAFIRNELMPVIKARYHTTGETAIVGESLAGLFVVETLALEPDLFDTYIAFDPSVWWNKGQLITTAAGRLRARPGLHKTLFLANGSDTALSIPTGRLAAELRTGTVPGLQTLYQPMLDETHATIYHPAALRAFRILFKPAPTPPK